MTALITTQINQVKSPVRFPTFLLLVIPLYLLTSMLVNYLPAGTVEFKVSYGLSALGALGILFFLPGFFFLPLFPRRKTLGFFEFLSSGVGLNWLFLLLITTGLKALGLALNKTNLLAVIIPVSIAAALLAQRRLQFFRIIPLPKKLLPLGGAIMAVLLIMGQVCFRPFLVNENRFWPNEYHRILGNLRFEPEKGDCASVKLTRDQNWREIDSQVWEPLSEEALIYLFNPTGRRCTYPLLFLFDSREEMQLDITLNGRQLFHCYLPPPYEITRCPRNYPPAKDIFSERVELLPGDNLIKFRFRRPFGENIEEKPKISVWDFSQTKREEFLKAFGSYYLIGDTGDIREQLNLARNLKSKILPFTYSYDGTFFDSGGHTTEHPLFPFVLKLVMLVLFEDSLRSFQILFWGLLTFLLFTLMVVSIGNGSVRKILPGILIGIVAASSLFLIRYRIDTPYIATTLSLTLVIALYHLRRRQTALFLLWATFTILIKGGIVFIGVGIVSFALVFREWRYPAKLIMAGGLIAIITLGPIFITSFEDASSAQWKILIAGNYWQRMAPMRALIAGNREAARLLSQSAVRYFWMANVGSCFLIAGWFLKKNATAKFFLLVSIFSFLAVALSKPSLLTRNYSGHRLSYLAPLIFLITLPAISSLARYSGKRATAILTLFCLLPLLAFPQIAPILESYRRAMAPLYLEVSHQASVIDYLLRRSEEDGWRKNLISKMFPRFLSGQGEEIWKIYQRTGLKLKEAGMVEEADVLFRQSHYLRKKRR